MRWNLFLGLGVGFLTSLALLPDGQCKSSPVEIANARRQGFNEGYESGKREVFRIVELRKLGEYYFDSANQRVAFRWSCDPAPAVDSPEDAPASSGAPVEPPRRVTQLSLDPKSRECPVIRRPVG